MDCSTKNCRWQCLTDNWYLVIGILLFSLFSTHFQSQVLAQFPQKVALDSFGDPLPKEAIARIGTTRFRHGSHVLSVCFLPDGKRIASAGMDGVIRIWTSKGKQLQRLPGREVSVFPFAVSPNGKIIASRDKKRMTVAIWHVATGRRLQSLPHHGFISTIAFSPNGKVLAVGDNRGKIALWDTENWNRLRFFSHSSAVSGLGFRNEDQILVSSSWDGSVVEWHTSTGRVEKRFGGSESRRALAVAPKIGAVASSDRLGTLQMWRQGKEILNLPRADARCLAFSPKEKYLGTGGHRRPIKLRDSKTGKVAAAFPGTHGAVAICFSPDGTKIAAAIGASVQIWDVEKRQPLFQKSETKPISTIAYSPSGQYVAVRPIFGRVSLWDLRTFKKVSAFGNPATTGGGLAFSPDGKTLAESDGKHIFLRNALDGQVRCKFQAWNVQIVRFSRDGRLLAAGVEQCVKVWDIDTGKLLHMFEFNRANIQSLAISFNGVLLAVGGVGSRVDIWDLKTGKKKFSLHHDNLKRSFGNRIRGIRFLPGNDRLVTLDRQFGLFLWDLKSKTKRPIAQWPVDGSISGPFDLSPDGALILVTTIDGRIVFLETETGATLRSIRGHQGSCYAKFAPDGRTFASYAADSTILFWPTLFAAIGNTGKSLDFERSWNKLTGGDGVLEAICLLVQKGDRAVAFLQKKASPISATTAKNTMMLVQQMRDKRFAIRTRAFNAILKLGVQAEPILLNSLKDDQDEESKTRVQLLLKKLCQRPAHGDELRLLRTVQVLEYIGTPAAITLLGEFGSCRYETRAVRAARAAVQRMHQQR